MPGGGGAALHPGGGGGGIELISDGSKLTVVTDDELIDHSL